MRDTEQYRNNSSLLLEDYGLDTVLPINIEALARELNITVVKVELDDEISGKISYDPINDEAKISINSHEPEYRQRFSLAHELAHYIYDIDFNEYNEIEDTVTHFRKMSNNPIEKRADKYAEKLLMPLALFKEKAKSIKNELFPDMGKSIGYQNIYKIVGRLSTEFNVSKPAVIYRLNSVGIINDAAKKKLFNYHYL